MAWRRSVAFGDLPDPGFIATGLRRPISPPQRRGPMGPMSDDTLTTVIRGVLAASPFHGEGHRKVWARLRHAGTRTSLRRVLRLMRENDLLAPGRVGSPRGPRNHDGTIIPDTVDTMWGTDLTTTFTVEMSRRVHRRGSFHRRMRGDPREFASNPFRGAGTDPPGRAPALRRIRQRHRPWARCPPRSRIAIHVGPLPEGDRVPRHRKLPRFHSEHRRSNGCAERFIRTLKENLLWVRYFETIEELRQALLEFRKTYNTTWLIQRHGYLSPATFRRRQLQRTAEAA